MQTKSTSHVAHPGTPPPLKFGCCSADKPGASGHTHAHEHTQANGASHAESGHSHHHHADGPGWWRLAIAGVAAVSAEALGWWAGAPGWTVAALALLAVGLSGLGTYRQGLRSILRADLNITALMTIAVTGALMLGEWPEAAMVMVLFAVAEAIEDRSLDHARHAIERLMEVAPESVWAQNLQGEWARALAVDVQPGTLLRVQPGERIGLDGRVETGASAVNQAPITGESIPVDKQPGDPIFAGSINGMAELHYRSESAYENSQLARIIHSVQQAQTSKAPIQRFVDRFARIYTPIVCALALVIAVAPPLLLQASWSEWLYKALVLLVIACPCALVISTPVAIVSGLAAAARHGILVKGGAYLEQGRKLVWVALDKTGTLTQGKPQLTDMLVIDDAVDAQACQRLAVLLAQRSDHPVSHAIAALPFAGSGDEVHAFRAVQGGGVQGEIGGSTYYLGNYAWVRGELDQSAGTSSGLPAEAVHIQRLEAQGNTVTVLASREGVLALFAVADTLKPETQEAIAQLRQLGVRTAMLSGDNQAAASSIGQKLGLDAVHAGLLPDQKLDAIKHYMAEGKVGMVGDGINDAPALAQADVGFAMGVLGTDTAIETADVALMDDDLRKLSRYIRLSRSTHAILVQNITLALGIKLAFLALTIVGLGTMWMAVFADVGASVLVILNSLRLLQK